MVDGRWSMVIIDRRSSIVDRRSSIVDRRSSIVDRRSSNVERRTSNVEQPAAPKPRRSSTSEGGREPFIFIGHFALGFAARRWTPRVSLGALFGAAQLADMLWPVLVGLGIEQVRIDPGNTAMTP